MAIATGGSNISRHSYADLDCTPIRSWRCFRHSSVSARTPHYARYYIYHVINAAELLCMCQQHVRHGERAGFRICARRDVLDGFKVDDVRKVKDTANHLACADAEPTAVRHRTRAAPNENWPYWQCKNNGAVVSGGR